MTTSTSLHAVNPRFSVILLTTLIGAGQGLFIALFIVEIGALFGLLTPPIAPWFYFYGALAVVRLHRRGARGVVLPPRPAGARMARRRRNGARRGCRAK